MFDELDEYQIENIKRWGITIGIGILLVLCVFAGFYGGSVNTCSNSGGTLIKDGTFTHKCINDTASLQYCFYQNDSSIRKIPKCID